MFQNLYTNPAKKEKKLDANEMTDMEAAALHSSRKKGRTLLLAKTAKTVNSKYFVVFYLYYYIFAFKQKERKDFVVDKNS